MTVFIGVFVLFLFLSLLIIICYDSQHLVLHYRRHLHDYSQKCYYAKLLCSKSSYFYVNVRISRGKKCKRRERGIGGRKESRKGKEGRDE